MAEQNTEGGRAFPLNLQTLLVLLTLASGAWLVSQTLTSTRPVALAGKSRGGIGAQTVEARLWEDPFKTLARTSQDNGSSSEGKEPLAMQIKDHHDTCTEGRQGWILPAMLPGGP